MQRGTEIISVLWRQTLEPIGWTALYGIVGLLGTLL